MEVVRFIPKEKSDFFKVLSGRVNAYFKDNNIKKTANGAMVFKSIALLALYLVPFGVLLSGIVVSGWGQMGLWILMGLGMTGVGFSVMHDANHGAYSKNQKVNKWLGHLVETIGGNALNWKIQHNVLHHTYTNIDGMDEDVESVDEFLRFTPHTKWLPRHKYQYLYAWGFYSLLTLFWCTFKDFSQLFRYKEKNLLRTQKADFKKSLVKLIVTKILYHGVVIGLPMLLLPNPWWHIILGFVAMHLVVGMILTVIFQLAHVMETSDFPMPENGVVDYDFATIQMKTTTDFAPNNKLLTWYVGGLNYQVVHHLFPNICHIHYKHLAPIVAETAKEYGIDYNVKPTFWSALVEHTRMLKYLGREDAIALYANRH